MPYAVRAVLLLALLLALPGCPPSQPRHARMWVAPQPAPARHLVASLP